MEMERVMTNEISPGYGNPGEPGGIVVNYLRGLTHNTTFRIDVGGPGPGGPGGAAGRPNSDGQEGIPNRGGAGGGRENIPIVEALLMYATSKADSHLAPLCFLQPGAHDVLWTYDTSTATMVIVHPGGGGGGGGGAGQVFLPGEDGVDGLGGAVFIFPTDLPTQRPLE